MISLKVTAIGSEVGLILPREAMAHLRVKQGDTIFLMEAPGGGFRLVPCDQELEHQLGLAEEVMHDDRDVLRTLAK